MNCFMQMMIEVQSWPYCFPASEDFPKSDQRGNVNGRLLIRDRYADRKKKEKKKLIKKTTV